MFVTSNEMQEKRFKLFLQRINASAGNKISRHISVKQEVKPSLAPQKIVSSHFLKRFDSANSKGSGGSAEGQKPLSTFVPQKPEKEESKGTPRLPQLEEAKDEEDDLFSD